MQHKVNVKTNFADDMDTATSDIVALKTHMVMPEEEETMENGGKV